MGKINVAVVDNNDRYESALSHMITEDEALQHVGTAKTKEELLHILRENSPDILVMSSILPKLKLYKMQKEFCEDKKVDGISDLWSGGDEKESSGGVPAGEGQQDEGGSPGSDPENNLKVEKTGNRNYGEVRYAGAGIFREDENTRKKQEDKGAVRDISEKGEKKKVVYYMPRDLSCFHDDQLERYVTDILHSMGVPANIKGYRYLRDAIIISVYDVGVLTTITKSLYPLIAERNNATVVQVERAIRHAIEVSWFRGEYSTIYAFFGYTVENKKGRPTNSEFIALVADKIRIDYKARNHSRF